MREIRDRGNNKAGWKEYEKEGEREKGIHGRGRKKERKKEEREF